MTCWTVVEWNVRASILLMALLPSLFSGADLSGLLELPESLQSLFAEGAAFGDSSAPVLAQLTQLDYLCLSYTPGFTDAGLEQFTDLNLGRLYVYNSGLSDAVSQGEGGMIDLKWTPDKVRTLLCLCSFGPPCACCTAVQGFVNVHARALRSLARQHTWVSLWQGMWQHTTARKGRHPSWPRPCSRSTVFLACCSMHGYCCPFPRCWILVLLLAAAGLSTAAAGGHV
jgi:hypothetical protein